MSQTQQSRADRVQLARGRGRLGAASRRAVEYFVADPHGAEANSEPGDGDTRDFAPEFAPEARAFGVPRGASLALRITRSGDYEREAVDARLAELEGELSVARVVAPPTGVEAEIQCLGEETAEILRVAHQKASEMVARATEEAAALRVAAKADAAAMTAAAERRLRELDAETDLIWAERTRLTDDTLRLAEGLREIAEGAVERFPAAAEDPQPAVAGPFPEEPGASGAGS